MANLYDRRTGKLLPSGITRDYSGVQDPSTLKYDEKTGQLNAIPADNLKPAVASKLPQLNQTYSEPITLSEITKNADIAKEQKDTAVSDYLKSLTEQADIQSKEAGYATAEGADIAQKEYDRYASELDAEKRAIDLKKREILSNASYTKEQAQNAINQLERTSYQKQADIAILGNAAKGRYDTAMDIAKRKVESELAPIKAEIEARKAYIDLYKDEWSQAQTAEANRIVRNEERKYNEEKATKDAIENIKLEYVKNGGKDIAQFRDTTTVDDALAKAGSYLASGNIEFQKIGDNVLRIDKLTGKVLNTYGSGSYSGNNFAITKNTLDTINNGDIVKTIANVINTSGAKQSQATNDAINVISGVQQLANANPDGVFIGAAPGIGFGYLRGAEARQKRIENQSAFDAINLKVQQWASGAALTAEQTKQVKKLTPDKNDTDFRIRQKLNALAQYMVGQVSGQLAGQGIGFSMEPVDLFNKKPLDQDPLKVFGGSSSGKDSLGLGI